MIPEPFACLMTHVLAAEAGARVLLWEHHLAAIEARMQQLQLSA